MDTPVDGPRAALAKTVSPWCVERGVRLCVPFGSMARSEEHAGSDADLALWLDSGELPIERLPAWQRELGEKVGRTASLVIVTPDLDPVLGFQIARDGIAIHESDPGLWEASRLRLWHAYQDAAPFLRTSRRLLEELAAGARHGT
jgi:predicted nucleotidyltransferase